MAPVATVLGGLLLALVAAADDALFARWPASDDDDGSISSQAWPEGELHVQPRAAPAAHADSAGGTLVRVTRAFDEEWHAMLTLRPFVVPPEGGRTFTLSSWGRRGAVAAPAADAGDAPPADPKLVFQDADDSYTPLKQAHARSHPHALGAHHAPGAA